MIIPFFKGILMGLTISVSIGPGFFAIFQTSLTRGFKAGYVLATGIFISDLVLILISYFGITNLLNKQYYLWYGLAGGIVLIGMGLASIFRKPVLELKNQVFSIESDKSLSLLFLHGFLVNITNPLNLVFWLGVVGFANTSFGINTHGFFLFMIGVIATAFISDIFKCYLSVIIKNALNNKLIGIINKSVGAVLLFAGFIIIYKVI